MVAVLLGFCKAPEIALQHFFLACSSARICFLFHLCFMHFFFFQQVLAGNFFFQNHPPLNGRPLTFLVLHKHNWIGGGRVMLLRWWSIYKDKRMNCQVIGIYCVLMTQNKEIPRPKKSFVCRIRNILGIWVIMFDWNILTSVKTKGGWETLPRFNGIQDNTIVTACLSNPYSLLFVVSFIFH